LSELMCKLSKTFGSENTDDYWEIEYWHRLFDWDNAAYNLYPGWWSSSPLPFPQLAATHFLNASWAKLFIPARPGYEHSAMRWIIGRHIDIPLTNRWETEIEKIKHELEQYRVENFGDATEFLTVDAKDQTLTSKFKVMGSWTEVLPTDGTHVEVVQSATTAADDVTAKDLEQAQTLRQAAIEEHQKGVGLKQKALDLMQQPVTVAINVDSNGSP